MSSTLEQLLFNAMLVRSAWAICSRSDRTPVSEIACVAAVPASLVGSFFREY